MMLLVICDLRTDELNIDPNRAPGETPETAWLVADNVFAPPVESTCIFVQSIPDGLLATWQVYI